MPVASLRKNGTVPSCEPCRKSKLSCDHETPCCGRCRRRKIADRCEYHPAPMTQNRFTDGFRNATAGWRAMPADRSNASSSPPAPTMTQDPDDSNPDLQYYGSTSYSAVFTEGQSHPQLKALPNADREEFTCTISDKDSCNVSPTKIKEGAKLLSLLSNIEKYRRGLRSWFEIQCTASALPFMGQCIEMVSRQEPVPSHQLTALSEMVFRNTAKPIPIYNAKCIEDIPPMLLGDNLRWEMVGLILTSLGLSAMAMEEIGELDMPESGHYNYKYDAKYLLDAGDKSIAFSESVGRLNEVGVWCIRLNYILHTQVYGDADHLCWRRLGDLTTAVYAIGLHREPKSTAPLFLQNIQRKTFWFSYNWDKTFATFFGRPPMINGSFISVKVPLDLDEEQWALEGEELQNEMNKIDENGWSTSEKISKTAWLRVSIICCKFREEILALSLGGGEYTDLEARAHDIMRRQAEAYDALPAKIRDRPSRWLLERSPGENFLSIEKFLDGLYNHFLLHRLVVTRLRTEPGELIRTCRAMLSSFLLLCGNRHRMGYFACDLPWLLVFFGLPPAGVLALELLQQSSPSTQHPPYTASTFQNEHAYQTPPYLPASATHSPVFPRSEIIQNLSVLVSSIDSIVRPSNGNYAICTQAKKMMQAILNTVLSAPPAPAAPAGVAQSQHHPSTYIAPTPTSMSRPVEQSQNFPESNSSRRVQYDTMPGAEANPTTAIPDVAFDGNAYMWFEDVNFDMDFWNSLEDHPLLA